MNAETSTACIPSEELVDYFAESGLSEARETEIERHLADCDDCTAKTRQLHAMSVVWEEWSAPTHTDAYRQVRLTQALEQVRQQTPEWGDRIGQWLTDWSGRAGAAARLVLDAASQTVDLVSEGLEALVTPANPWDFHLGAAPRVAVARGRGRGGPSAGTSPVPATPQVYMQAIVHPSGAPGSVLVTVEGLKPPQQQAGLLVLLIPADGEGGPWVQALQPPVQGQSMALFQDIPPGEYLVAFEPRGGQRHSLAG